MPAEEADGGRSRRPRQAMIEPAAMGAARRLRVATRLISQICSGSRRYVGKCSERKPQSAASRLMNFDILDRKPELCGSLLAVLFAEGVFSPLEITQFFL